MNRQDFILSIFVGFLFIHVLFGQEKSLGNQVKVQQSLFESEAILPLRMTYSNKQLKRETNDSTYVKTIMAYQLDDQWHDIDLEIRVRGKFRLANCYFAPLKLSIAKKNARGTLFEGHKKLKIVLPCLQQKDNSDNVIKEFVAYKMYEHISPHYFKTRLVDFLLNEPRGNKFKEFRLKAFLIEDDKNVAKRFNGNIYERSIHPMNQDALTSVRHAFFQYMIGNTDFSTAEQHNVKLIFTEDKMIPVPFDFDMSGLVNCSYATVSELGREQWGMHSVKDRRYRGFARERKIFQVVRQEFLEKQQALLACLDECAPLFDNLKEFETARDYVLEFFNTLRNDKMFREHILDKVRIE